MTPREARTEGEICSLPRDNVATDGYWMILDGLEVTLAYQQPGEKAAQEITLPRATFEAFLDWYNTGTFRKQRRKRRKRGKRAGAD